MTCMTHETALAGVPIGWAIPWMEVVEGRASARSRPRLTPANRPDSGVDAGLLLGYAHLRTLKMWLASVAPITDTVVLDRGEHIGWPSLAAVHPASSSTTVSLCRVNGDSVPTVNFGGQGTSIRRSRLEGIPAGLS